MSFHFHPHNRIFFLAACLVFLGLILVGLFFFFFSSSSFHPIFSSDSIRNCVDVDRGSYALTPSIFSDLPPIPKCFVSAVSAYRSGSFSDVSFFDSSYYLQPEFYPHFVSQGLSAWKSPQYTHYGAIGFGAYPPSLTLSSSPPFSPISVSFFVFSGFGVRSLQSMTLHASVENPLDANAVSIRLDDVSQNGFLLGPSFPKFSNDWARAAFLEVTPLRPLVDHPIVIVVRTVHTSSFFSDPRTTTLLFFDSTDYVGEKEIFRLTIAPSS